MDGIMRKLPIGIQTFEKLREGAYLSPFNTYKYNIISNIYIHILKQKPVIPSYI
jgi:hypothetical protein